MLRHEKAIECAKLWPRCDPTIIEWLERGEVVAPEEVCLALHRSILGPQTPPDAEHYILYSFIYALLNCATDGKEYDHLLEPIKAQLGVCSR